MTETGRLKNLIFRIYVGSIAAHGQRFFGTTFIRRYSKQTYNYRIDSLIISTDRATSHRYSIKFAAGRLIISLSMVNTPSGGKHHTYRILLGDMHLLTLAELL